ncbi:hypothetical protein, partial [Bacillus wiedmannii]
FDLSSSGDMRICPAMNKSPLKFKNSKINQKSILQIDYINNLKISKQKNDIFPNFIFYYNNIILYNTNLFVFKHTL